MEEFDCRSCGACCVSFEDQGYFCDVDDDDLAKLSRAFVRKNVEMFACPQLLGLLAHTNYVCGAIMTKWVEVKSGPLKDYELNVCRALRGSVMSKVSCSIYKNRPRTCKIAVSPGSRACREVRRAFKNAIDEIGGADG